MNIAARVAAASAACGTLVSATVRELAQHGRWRILRGRGEHSRASTTLCAVRGEHAPTITPVSDASREPYLGHHLRRRAVRAWDRLGCPMLHCARQCVRCLTVTLLTAMVLGGMRTEARRHLQPANARRSDGLARITVAKPTDSLGGTPQRFTLLPGGSNARIQGSRSVTTRLRSASRSGSTAGDASISPSETLSTTAVAQTTAVVAHTFRYYISRSSTAGGSGSAWPAMARCRN